MATTAASEVTDGPVLSLLNKRLRALRKKHNRILQMEDAISQGKTINKEQEEVLRSKPAVLVLMDEYEKLRQPMSAALEEELNLAVQRHQVSVSPPVAVDNDAVNKDVEEKADGAEIEKGRQVRGSDDKVVEDLLNLLYFGSLFDVKPQSDFTSTMLTRTHERGCCLTYDYVTDDETVLLGEKDLDTISTVSSLLISRPVHSALSHKNALQRCIEHAKLWLANSDDPIEAETTITCMYYRLIANRNVVFLFLCTVGCLVLFIYLYFLVRCRAKGEAQQDYGFRLLHHHTRDESPGGGGCCWELCFFPGSRNGR